LIFSNEPVLPDISPEFLSFPIDKFQEENFRNKMNFTEKNFIEFTDFTDDFTNNFTEEN